jgi:Ala-tRNA(Pro) deacylase
MDVYIAEALTHHDEIAFNAGTHTEVIKMSYVDFERLVHPKVTMFTT